MPDQSPSHDVLPCDCCGADMSARLDQLIHVSGTLNGIECNHIHLCPQCALGLNLPRIAVSRGKCVPIPLSAQGVEPGYWPAPHQLSADIAAAASEQVRWSIIYNEDPAPRDWLPFVRGAWRGCAAKITQCTIRLDGGKVCEKSRRVLDKKFNMDS